MGYMDNPLSPSLESHFKTIVLMLAEGKVPDYEMIQQFETNRFEQYLKDKRINYIKKSIFKPFKEPSFLFSLALEEL